MSSSPTRPSSSASNNEKQKNGKPSLVRKGTASPPPPPFGSSRPGEDGRHPGQKPPPPQSHSASPAPKAEHLNGSGSNGAASNGISNGSVAIDKNGTSTKTSDKNKYGEKIHSPTIHEESESAFEVLPGAKVFFTGYTNAVYEQRITIFCSKKEPESFEELGFFEGNGENTPMKFIGKSHLSGGVKKELVGSSAVLALPISLDIRYFKARFEYKKGTSYIGSKTLTPVNIGKHEVIETISINSVESSGGDDFCDSQLKCDILFPDLNNPTRILIPKDHAVSISAMANAFFEQNLVCRIDNGPLRTFSGRGENQPMLWDGKKLLTLDPYKEDRWLTGIFLFVDGDNTRKLARVNKQLLVTDHSEFRSVTVSSEDSSKVCGMKDKNDTVLRVVAIRSHVYHDLDDLNARPRC